MNIPLPTRIMAPTTDSLANGSVRLLETPSTAKDTTQDNGRTCGFLVKSGSGFTLVEVIFALGVCSFALLPLMSLLPIALDSSCHALEISRIAKAFQKVASDLTQSPFTSVASMPPTAYYFDYDGNMTTASSKYFTVLATVSTSPIPNQSSASLLKVMLESQTLRETNAGATTITICDMGYGD